MAEKVFKLIEGHFDEDPEKNKDLQKQYRDVVIYTYKVID